MNENSPYIARLEREAAMPTNPNRPGTFAHAEVEAYRAGRHHTQQQDTIENHPW
jgi:hypothetical protein